jgi:hypothetical protein
MVDRYEILYNAYKDNDRKEVVAKKGQPLSVHQEIKDRLNRRLGINGEVFPQ